MRKLFNQICTIVLMLAILLLAGCSSKSALVGTWTIQDGRFTVQAFFDDAYAEGPDRGVIEFTRDENYILTDELGRTTTGRYAIVSDSVLALDFQGTVNTYVFSVSNGELSLVYQDVGNYTSLWIRN